MSAREKGRHWTPEEFKEWLWDRAMELGRVPTAKDMKPHHGVAVRLFGSIRGAQEAAGFRPNPRGRPRHDA